MKNKYFLAMVLSACFAIFSAQAQFTDDFNWIDIGECPPWWSSWTGECISVGNGGCSPPYNGYMRPSDPGAGDVVDPVLNLGNQTSGLWSLKFCMYVPSNREAYFNLQGIVPVGGGEWIVGNIHFNQDLLTPGEGLIDNSALGAVTYNFPHDQWFDIEMNFDLTGGIDNATWEFIVDNGTVLPAGTPFTDSNGTVPTSLGGVNFFSISADNEYFIDLIEYTNEMPNPSQDPYFDDMEYDEPLSDNAWWEYGPIAINGTNTYSGSNAGYMSDGTSATSVLNFGNKIFGFWYNIFYLYVPSGKEAAFSIQGEMPLVDGGSVVGDIIFNEDGTNPGVGKVTDSALGEVTFTFPQDQWFRVRMWWDITAGIDVSVWYMDVDGVTVIPAGTDFTNSNGDYPTAVGGLVYKARSADSEFWVDDIIFSDLVIGVEDFSNLSFSLSPNPALDEVRIQTENTFKTVHIYNLEGKLVLQTGQEEIINVASLPAGVYFVEIHNEKEKSIQKLVKR
ncbi:T9SS type A sorting domain-containing protein [Aureisphaera galaxeae]|uniref:T9SS type A sorting domain-containing protein n=1 Tax=Aureisphaera galaxeae TaxID=1538023 RepID=UPI0023503C43|nr:T9SS type A sorting domain-containing protein [Aureisphaera galaxeae]MDC8004770.1 T9SS type A sorting domain-containing protein [Aureisphaera galaxeae]